MAKLRHFVIFNYSIIFAISYHLSPKLNTQNNKRNRVSDKWKETQGIQQIQRI